MRYPAIFAAALAVAFTVPAAAAGNAGSSVSVKYSDLDLSTEAGQATLDRRIEMAARAACGMSTIRTDSRMPSQSARKCYDEAKATVHKQVAELIARNNARG